MSEHLTDAEVAAALAGEAVDERHLAGCASCRRELETLWTAIAGLRRPAGAEAPPVLARRPGLARRPAVPLAAAAALALALGGLVGRTPEPPASTTAPLAPARSADDQLLDDVERALSREVPRALAPAALLAADLDAAVGRQAEAR